MPGVTFRVLGPLEAEGERGPVNLKGPRHRAVLARLLIARGRTVPASWLIDDLWDDPPERALGAIQTFVGALRKALEPDRPPRTPARLLVTAPPGYALRTEPDAVDAWRFETALGEAAALPPEKAFARLDEALALWRGPAYAEFADEDWARGEAARLDELRLLGVERRAEAAMALGRSAEVVAELEAHVAGHPLREDARRLLALALYKAGRQADALAALRDARTMLSTELGLDPGEALRRLENDIFAQAPHLTAQPLPEEHTFVGRAEELAALERFAKAAGGPRLALISGDPGAGKTALASEISRRMGARVTVLDDMQSADEAALAELIARAGDADAGPVLLVGTYRSTEITPALADALGRAARYEPLRIHLGGLTEPEVRELIASVAFEKVDEPVVRAIHRRSSGNPFFVRELIRLYEAQGDLDGVPAGVRDVIRHRLAALPEAARTVLRQAAVIGTDVDLDLLIELNGDEDRVLDAVEPALLMGFLAESGPERLRFEHALVREALYDDIAQARRSRWHARAAELIERSRPDNVAEIAEHFIRAGTRTTADRAARYARAAAERAEERFAPHEAARLWRETVAALDRAGDTDAPARLEAVMGMGRALAVTGDLDGARARRAEAIRAAERWGDPLLTARVIGAFEVPANWATSDDTEDARAVAEAAERTLAALPPDREAERARLLATVAMELRAHGGERGRTAARESEEIARRLDDPTLLAFALNARFMQSFERAGMAPERARIGAELVDLAGRHGLVPFEVLGHMILLQARAALADFAAADEHAVAADRLAERHELPLVGVFTDWYRAMRSGEESAYRRAAVRLSGTGMRGVEGGLLPLALLSLRLRDDDDAVADDVDYGPYEPWVRPLILLSQGKRDQVAAYDIPESPHDLLFELRMCLHALVAIELGDRAAMERLHAELLPAAGELAGAGSGMVTLRPVAYYLERLATRLGPLAGDGPAPA